MILLQINLIRLIFVFRSTKRTRSTRRNRKGIHISLNLFVHNLRLHAHTLMDPSSQQDTAELLELQHHPLYSQSTWASTEDMRRRRKKPKNKHQRAETVTPERISPVPSKGTCSGGLFRWMWMSWWTMPGRDQPGEEVDKQRSSRSSSHTNPGSLDSSLNYYYFLLLL